MTERRPEWLETLTNDIPTQQEQAEYRKLVEEGVIHELGVVEILRETTYPKVTEVHDSSLGIKASSIQRFNASDLIDQSSRDHIGQLLAKLQQRRKPISNA